MAHARQLRCDEGRESDELGRGMEGAMAARDHPTPRWHVATTSTPPKGDPVARAEVSRPSSTSTALGVSGISLDIAWNLKNPEDREVTLAARTSGRAGSAGIAKAFALRARAKAETRTICVFEIDCVRR